jgi:hypothetical protein
LPAGTYAVSGQIIIASKRLYGNNDTSAPTRFVAAAGAVNSAMELQGVSPGVDWIEFDAAMSSTRLSDPANDCINVNGATGSKTNPVFIANSTFKNCPAGGIFNNDWDIGPSNWVVIAANWIYNSNADCIHNSTSGPVPVKNLLIEYNLEEQCGDDGVAVGSYVSANPTTNVVIQYNTVKNQNWAQGISEWVPCAPAGSCVARNNYVYQSQGYVSSVTGSQDSHACIMLEAESAYGGIGPSDWLNQNNDCVNRGAYQGHANYMMSNGASFAGFGSNTFVNNTSLGAHADCIRIEGSPNANEAVTGNVCAAPVGPLLVNNSGVALASQAGNLLIQAGAYSPINAPGGGPGTDPNYR